MTAYIDTYIHTASQAYNKRQIELEGAKHFTPTLELLFILDIHLTRLLSSVRNGNVYISTKTHIRVHE